jgi:predicted nuclease with TOPRIM domain
MPATPFANTGEGLRHLIERLEARTAEATELRIRLELTERAQSTLEEELEEANMRLEEAEQELAELRRRVDDASEPSDAPQVAAEEPERAAPQSATEASQEGAGQPRRRSWWREFFGFD